MANLLLDLGYSCDANSYNLKEIFLLSCYIHLNILCQKKDPRSLRPGSWVFKRRGYCRLFDSLLPATYAHFFLCWHSLNFVIFLCFSPKLLLILILIFNIFGALFLFLLFLVAISFVKCECDVWLPRKSRVWWLFCNRIINHILKFVL